MESEQIKNSNKLLANRIMQNLKKFLPRTEEVLSNLSIQNECTERLEVQEAQENYFSKNSLGVILPTIQDSSIVLNSQNCSLGLLPADFSLIGNQTKNILELEFMGRDNKEEQKNNETKNPCNSESDEANFKNQLFIGKKSYRHPNDEIKEILSKHNIGNFNCEEIILSDEKYDQDIKMIINWAEENHPFKLVIEFCQKFKWPLPETFILNTKSIDIGEMVDKADTSEAPLFKTTISVKNNTFKGEALGLTKKISKKKAAVNVLINMLEDTFVRDSIKIFVKDLILKKQDTNSIKLLSQQTNDEEQTDEISNSNRASFEEKQRVEKALSEFHQNNPLIYLSYFKDKVKIPFSFTFTQRGLIRIANVFVGSEIFGIGEDKNLKLAKYKAAAEALLKIKHKYGEEIFQTKRDRKNKKTYEIKEDIVPDDEKKNEHHPNLEILEKLCEEFKIQNYSDNTFLILQRQFEIFCLKYERNINPINFNEIQKIISKLLYINKSISFHFSKPQIVGSFANSCWMENNKQIDILFTHSLNSSEMKSASESLLKNFNLIFNNSSEEPIINLARKKDETNYDIEVSYKDSDFSFNLILKKSEEWDNYIIKHDLYLMDYKNASNSFNLSIMKRLFRSWRRKFNLMFIPAEILDWMVLMYQKLTLSDSFAKVLHKMRKDFSSIFKAGHPIPAAVLSMTSRISNEEENLKRLEFACNQSITYITEGKFEELFL